MRYILFPCTLSFVLCGSAQTWCPPGAEWKYDVVGFGIEGCGIDTYSGDTVLIGLPAQRIHQQTSIHYYFSDTTINSASNYFTANEDGIVYQYLPMNAEWDTLYWLTAPIGARWFPPGVEPDTTGCPPPGGMVQVVDTGSVTLSGIPISYRDVMYIDMSGTLVEPSFRIHERFGSLSVGLPSGGCIISEWPFILNTFSDQLGLIYTSGNAWSCPEWLAVREPGSASATKIFPNPGTDRFSLTIPISWKATLIVHDALGRPIFNQYPLDPKTTVDASAWSAGVYHLLIRDQHGRAHSLAWVKQ